MSNDNNEQKMLLDTALQEAQFFASIINHFNQNAQRAFRLIQFATKANLEGVEGDEIKIYIEDNFRSCVVFIHSALETSLRDLIIVRLKAKAESEPLIKVPLIGLKHSEKFSWGELFPHRHKTISELVNESIDAYASKLSFNSTSEIAAHLKDIGIDLKYLKPLFSDLDAMIERRHQIVHEADYQRNSKQKKLESITYFTLTGWITNAEEFVYRTVCSTLISESYTSESNKKLKLAGKPPFVHTEESIAKLFNRTKSTL